MRLKSRSMRRLLRRVLGVEDRLGMLLLWRLWICLEERRWRLLLSCGFIQLNLGRYDTHNTLLTHSSGALFLNVKYNARWVLFIVEMSLARCFVCIHICDFENIRV